MDTRSSANTAPPIMLGGYAAKQCPVRTHNDFAPLIPTPQWEPSPDQQADLDAGIAFEAEVFKELLRLHPQAVVVDPRLPKDEAISRTMAAMGAGTPLILGGWLPDDEVGGRKGKPDILIGVDGGFIPADVKNHGTVGAAKRKSVVVSTLDTPTTPIEVGSHKLSSHYFDDGIQLAHYTRMLQTLGFHPGEHRLAGAILGTSVMDPRARGGELVLVWIDLTEPLRETFSRIDGKVRRSLLECYDHEHAGRLRVAATAVRIVGSETDPEPLVFPIGQKECGKCPYESWCAEQMGPHDASVAITVSRLDTKEWQALRRRALGTVTELAGLDPYDPEFLEPYVLDVAHLGRDNALKRLSAAVQQARMIRDDLDIEPVGDAAVTVPAADIEIDLDLEWDSAGRIYLWGLRIREDQDDSTARYEPVVSFEELDDAAEQILAERAAAWIAEQRDRAEREGKSLVVFHWHHVEVSKTRKFDCAVAALDGVSSDLLTWFTNSFHVRGSAGIKHVAPLFGFTWSVDEPGGRSSQEKIELVRAAGSEADDARRWCLSYNESDVAAQAAIRDGVRRRIADPAQLRRGVSA